MDIFSELESNVQCYARAFPAVFDKAQGALLTDKYGQRYIDFLAGAGSLNYGHNNPVLKRALLNYIEHDGIAHSLDLHTSAKEEFLKTFKTLILEPREMSYHLQFTGPTGANAVEAALKLARKVKGRTNIIAFTNGFHGVTQGALSATGNRHHREGAGIPLQHIIRMPYCGYHGWDVDTLKMMDRQLSDPSSGIDLPSAVIIETIQGEGGLNVAEKKWLQGLSALCRKHDMLLIVDDIQAGCGRSGTFFSFESYDIQPDIITLSKSLSGFGLPMAIVLLKPELDIWQPGEHNGTFRGNNHAFVTATAALKHYWTNSDFEQSIAHKAQLITKAFKSLSARFGVTRLRCKGRGLMQGLECASGEIAEEITQQAFQRGLIVETSGNRGQVVKAFCPLTIEESVLEDGLAILTASVIATLSKCHAQVS